jgi:hypothetical protein
MITASRAGRAGPGNGQPRGRPLVSHQTFTGFSVTGRAAAVEGSIACHPFSIRTAGSSTVAAARRMSGISVYPMAVWEQAIACQRARQPR